MSRQNIAKGVYVSGGTVFKFASSKKNNPDEKPSNIVVSKNIIETTTSKGKEIVSWGPGNIGPKGLLRDINKVGVAGKILDISADAHFGTGLSVYREDDEGKKKTIPFRMHPKLSEFDKVNNWNLFYSESILDFETHEMMFVEYCLTNNYEEIAYIKRHDPNQCRFEVMNPLNGRIENIYLNADWENYEDQTTFVIDAFSQYDYFEVIKEVCKNKKIRRFIICYHNTKNGELYYNNPRWQAPFRNKWVDIILNVPAIKKHFIEQNLNINFVVHISEDYFKSVLGKDDKNVDVWDQMSGEDREKEYNEVMDLMDDHLTGVEAAGRSLTIPMVKGFDGKMEKTILIERIDSTLKDGAMLADATAGAQELCFAKGVDPAITGVGIPGSQNQSGSGSNKREAYTILCASKVRPRTITLLPFYLVRDWNNWGDDLYGSFPNVILTTLDKETSGQTEVTN